MMTMAQIRDYMQREIARLGEEAKRKQALGLELTEDEQMILFEAECHEACLTAIIDGRPAS